MHMPAPDTILLISLAVLTVAAVTALFLLQHRAGKERSRIVRHYEDEKDILQDKIASLSADKAALAERLAARVEFEEREKEQHVKDLATMKEVFENLGNRNSESFKVRSTEALTELLKPLQEKFREFSETVKESSKDAADRHSKLEQRIEDLDRQSRSVSDEARNLANALTGYSKVQGDFGEMLLTDVLKNAGLVEGIHFMTQGVITDTQGREIKSVTGRTMIPDVLVFYPDDTTVVIDSKVSLKDFNSYMAATGTQERKAYAKAHVKCIRDHVNELKDKDYASYIPSGKQKVDYNIMFIPMEGAFRLMLDEDPTLWQVARENNVLIVSQMTLVIVLNMITMSWKQHNQEKDIARVYSAAEGLMSQLKNWMDSFVEIGKSLESATKAYDTARKRLSDSDQSVIKKIGRLEEMGLKPKRSKSRITSKTRLPEQGSIIPGALEDNQETTWIDPVS